MTNQNFEPILHDNPRRFVLFPIEHDDIWKFYKKAKQAFGRLKKLISIKIFLIGKRN